MNEVLSRSTNPLGALSMDDDVGRIARARMFTMGGSVERRFGFWASKNASFLPLPVARGESPNPETETAIQMLLEINRFAGYVVFPKPEMCIFCHGEKKIGRREFVFRPLPSGFTYRWPEGFLHYMIRHNVEVPEWFPELVNDFSKARAMGLWKS